MAKDLPLDTWKALCLPKSVGGIFADSKPIEKTFLFFLSEKITKKSGIYPDFRFLRPFLFLMPHLPRLLNSHSENLLGQIFFYSGSYNNICKCARVIFEETNVAIAHQVSINLGREKICLGSKKGYWRYIWKNRGSMMKIKGFLKAGHKQNISQKLKMTSKLSSFSKIV